MMQMPQTDRLQTRSAFAGSMCALALAVLFMLATVENVHARHAPNRYDRRADRETRIPYSRLPSQPNPRRTVVVHSAPSTPEASPPAATGGNQAIESDAPEPPETD